MRAPRVVAALAAVLMLQAWGAAPASAQPGAWATAVSPAEAVERALATDGETVSVSGEAIGEALRADKGHVWLNILGEGRAIGVYADRAATADVTTFGDWGHTGDTVLATGVLNAACDQHGGDLDIHATEVSVIQRGGPAPRPVGYVKGTAGAALSAAAAGLFALFMRRRRRLEV